MNRWRWYWAAVLATIAAVETHGIAHGGHATLSHTTRTTFHTHHPAGRAAFALAWAALSAWLLPHICRKVGT